MNLPLHWRILIALAAAVFAGTVFGDSEWLLKATGMIGALFLNALSAAASRVNTTKEGK